MRQIAPGVMLAALVTAAAAKAEDQAAGFSLQRTLELPAHRALVARMAEHDALLAPFETDGCSGGMSWSWRVVAEIFPDFAEAQGAHPPWEACCVTHDRVYHDAGGAADPDESYDLRLAADEALRQCVAAPPAAEVKALAARYEVPEDRIRLAYDLIAGSMFNAVRFGGGPCSGLPWRWGFGYPGCVPGL